MLPAEGLLVAGWDDPAVRRIAEARQETGGGNVIGYGLGGGQWSADQISANPAGGMDFTALFEGKPVVDVSLRLPGLHNVQNALAALAVAAWLEADLHAATEGLAAFGGMGRRFEVLGNPQDVTIIDDYAHHPTAIRATLAAARLRYPEQTIWAIWQPHTYSRTAALLDDFALAFDGADHVIITDVFRSRDTHDYGVSVEDVLARMQYHPDAQHIGALADVTEYLTLNVTPGDVVIVMSAGDATQISRDLLAELGGSEDEL
jgi:UDP-N-acetylmuramate--alanine ligase